MWVVGAVVWVLQPLYIVVEIVIGRHASTSYSFTDSTISDLGDTRCRDTVTGLLCSPWHSGMNVTFVWFGCTLAIGALLLGSRLLDGRLGLAAVALFVFSGVGSVGVGLTPVNENPGLHTGVALPVFVGMLGALLTMGLALLAEHPRLGRATLVVAAVTAVGVAVFFGLIVTDGTSATGAFERLALWPGYVWVSVTAVTAVLDRRRSLSPA